MHVCVLECVCVIFHRTSSQCLLGSVFWAPSVSVWTRQWPSQSLVSRAQHSVGSSWESQSAPVFLVEGEKNHISERQMVTFNSYKRQKDGTSICVGKYKSDILIRKQLTMREKVRKSEGGRGGFVLTWNRSLCDDEENLSLHRGVVADLLPCAPHLHLLRQCHELFVVRHHKADHVWLITGKQVQNGTKSRLFCVFKISSVHVKNKSRQDSRLEVLTGPRSDPETELDWNYFQSNWFEWGWRAIGVGLGSAACQYVSCLNGLEQTPSSSDRVVCHKHGRRKCYF